MSPAADSPQPRRRRPWKVSLSGVVADEVREVWIEDQSYLGAGRLTAGAEIEIGGPMTLQPSTLELTGGRILTADEVVAEEARLHCEVRSDGFVPRENRGRDALGFLSGRFRFESPRTSFGFLDNYFQSAPWIEVGGIGDVEIDVTVDHGQLAPGSRVTVAARDLTLDALDLIAGGRGEILAEVSAAGGGVETRLSVRLDDFELVERASTSLMMALVNLRTSPLRRGARTSPRRSALPRPSLDRDRRAGNRRGPRAARNLPRDRCSPGGADRLADRPGSRRLAGAR